MSLRMQYTPRSLPSAGWRLTLAAIGLVTLLLASAASRASPALMAASSGPKAAEPRIEVLALFPGRALLRIDGEQVVLRAGERSDHGVVLVSADNTGAVVSWGGRQRELALSRQSGGMQVEAAPQEIRVSPNRLGQYYVPGQINGQPVSFMVDTGASMVAISQRQAQQLGLPYRQGELGSVVTAQGQTQAYYFYLESVEVGGMRAEYVQAAVIEGDYPVDILLGMSFLSQVRLEHDGSILLLQERR